MYSHLFTVEEPTEAWELELNPESLVVYKGARVDPSLRNWDPKVESSFQVRFLSGDIDFLNFIQLNNLDLFLSTSFH
jgi:hypothetical protein